MLFIRLRTIITQGDFHFVCHITFLSPATFRRPSTHSSDLNFFYFFIIYLFLSVQFKQNDTFFQNLPTKQAQELGRKYNRAVVLVALRPNSTLNPQWGDRRSTFKDPMVGRTIVHSPRLCCKK
jgi:hypothetical protein